MEYNKHILCLYQGGGLGNDIFQYASMYAIAESKGMRFVVPADLNLIKISSTHLLLPPPFFFVRCVVDLTTSR